MKSTFNTLITFFFSGLLLLVPISLSVYLIVHFFRFVDTLIPHYETLKEFYFPGLGVLLITLVITLIGFIFTKIIRFPVDELLDEYIGKLPVISMIYSSARDLMKAFVGEERRFNKPVLITVSHTEKIYKLGFITDITLQEINIKEGFSAVYCPHSFNFSGELFIYPNTSLKALDINSASLMKYIVSGGITELLDEEKLVKP